MQPLPLRAAQDMIRLLHQPVYRNQNFKLWLSYFEIYGGKLYDLLSDRRLVVVHLPITFFFPGAGNGCMHILTLSISLRNQEVANPWHSVGETVL